MIRYFYQPSPTLGHPSLSPSTSNLTGLPDDQFNKLDHNIQNSPYNDDKPVWFICWRFIYNGGINYVFLTLISARFWSWVVRNSVSETESNFFHFAVSCFYWVKCEELSVNDNNCLLKFSMRVTRWKFASPRRTWLHDENIETEPALVWQCLAIIKRKLTTCSTQPNWFWKPPDPSNKIIFTLQAVKLMMVSKLLRLMRSSPQLFPGGFLQAMKD